MRYILVDRPLVQFYYRMEGAFTSFVFSVVYIILQFYYRMEGVMAQQVLQNPHV